MANKTKKKEKTPAEKEAFKALRTAEKAGTPLTPAQKELREKIDGEKVANFKRLAEKRVGNALGALEKVGALTTPNYKFDAAAVEKIKVALETKVAAVVATYTAALSGKKATGGGFAL